MEVRNYSVAPLGKVHMENLENIVLVKSLKKSNNMALKRKCHEESCVPLRTPKM